MGAESSTMQNAASTCKGCKNLGNKQVDTVKLDMEKLAGGASASVAAGKENSDPGQMRESPAQKNQREQEQRLKRSAEEREEARRRAVEEAEERKRLFELEELRKQQEKEELERIAAEEEEAAQKAKTCRQAEEEEFERLKARIQKEEEEEERLLKQKEEEEEAGRRRAEEEEEQARKNQRLQAFLEKGGFDKVSEKKVKKGIISSGFLYPLHAAVEQKDAEAVELLLWAGADPCLANSKKLTPLKLAQAKNKQGSHDKVIAALAA